MDTTSVSLLERLRQPLDQPAWKRFVDLYTPMIYSWARRTGLQESDAADLVQEVFAHLVEKMREFAYDPARRFRSWLRTVTMNKWRDRCRRQASRPAEVGELPSDLPDSVASSFSEVEYRRHLVARALELMQSEFQPATWRACWEFVVNGRSAAEVAKQVGISVNAVYLAKGRVLRRLRQELAGLFEDEK